MSNMWYLFFAVAVNAIAFAPPPMTLSEDIKPTLAIPETTSIPLANALTHEILRRATTEQAEASICGYYDGSKNSRLACYWGNCVFHASDADFPGMVGCCPTTSTTTPCTFFSTCYNSANVARTSSLKALTADPFVLLCTDDEDSYCHTRTWPDLAVADYACTDEPSSAAEIMYTVGSLTDVEDDEDQITETLSISWIGDSVLWAIKGVSATTTTAATTTTTSLSSTTTQMGQTSSSAIESTGSSGSSTSTGTIVGAVVGSVVGLLVILAAGWFLWRHNKNKRKAAESNQSVARRISSEPSLPGDKKVDMHELHGIDARERQELMPEREFVELPTREVRYELE